VQLAKTCQATIDLAPEVERRKRHASAEEGMAVKFSDHGASRRRVGNAYGRVMHRRLMQHVDGMARLWTMLMRMV
jgi:hypothetical protein